MRARRLIEDVIKLNELAAQIQSGNINRSAWAEAYGGLLRLAGARVTDEAVYEALFDVKTASQVANTLLETLMPTSARAGVGGTQANPTLPLKTSSKSRLAKAG
jgi:hypothetical protein